MNNEPADRMPSDKAAENLANAPRKVQSESLLGRAKELVIMHNGREYRLRMTQSGKLILTA
jgi:hemin uptake protein HemP